MTSRADTVVALRASGVSFVLELTSPIPRVLHWGADLGEIDPERLLAQHRQASRRPGPHIGGVKPPRCRNIERVELFVRDHRLKARITS